MHIRLLTPANSAHLISLRSAAVHEINLYPSCRLAWHLQTAHAVNHIRMHLRFEMLTICIGLCLPSAVLQCGHVTSSKSILIPWGCHVALMWCTRRCSARMRLLATSAWAAWHRHSYMFLTQGSLPPNPRNHCNCRAWHNCSGNLPTKLSRGSRLSQRPS